MDLIQISLIVPDYDPAIAWFTDVLGWRLVQDEPQGGKRWVVVAPEEGGTGIVLARAANDRQRAAIGDQGAGRVWLFLKSDNFARDHDRLVAAGVNFEEPPRYEPYGIVSVFQDPWGNRWDLIEPSQHSLWR